MSMQQSQEGQPSVSTTTALSTTPTQEAVPTPMTMLTVLDGILRSVMRFYCAYPDLEIKTTTLLLLKNIIGHMVVARNRPDDIAQLPLQFGTLLVSREILVADICYQSEQVKEAIAAIGVLVDGTPVRFGGSQIW